MNEHSNSIFRATHKCHTTQAGFTLIEVVIVIIVTGILVAVAMNAGQHITETARTEETKQELDALAKAIIGNPDLQNSGIRTDYGYVGDIGAMPSTLADLYTNPGSYATWNGPYISNRFSQVSDDYNKDAWGTAYTYGGGVSITSTGSGSNIVRNLVGSTDHLLYNSLSGTSLDKHGKPPGNTYRDSVEIHLTFPDGAGSTTTKTTNPDAGGFFSIDSIPIGNHSLKVIFLPTADTLQRYVSLSPNTSPYEGYFLGTDVFESVGGGGTLTLVSGTEAIYGGFCDKISFSVENNSGSDVSITDITLTYGSPSTYYKKLKVNGTSVFDSESPRGVSGETKSFSSQTISAGSSIEIKFEWFCDEQSGACVTKTNVQNTTFTVLFSDGSSFDVTVGGCT